MTAATAFRDRVRAYWEREPCGTTPLLTGDAEPYSPEWFARIEQRRYEQEPYIHAEAQFTRHGGERLLEIGVGAGTDHLQWARAGAECIGIDLTDAALVTTRAHLGLHGFEPRLGRSDAEALPFGNDSFDLVYSWGVLHHANAPERAIAEVWRVLRPGGTFIGMLYGRHSPLAVKAWVRHALLKGRPQVSLKEIIGERIQSGAKAYTRGEIRELYGQFSQVAIRPYMTVYDTSRWPRWLSRFFPDDWGWFIAIEAVK